MAKASSRPGTARGSTLRIAPGIAEGILLLLAVALGVVTVITVQAPNLRFGIFAPQLDALINEAATLIAGAAAGLAWLRHRYMRDPSAVFETGAFVLLTMLAVVQLAASVGIATDFLGLNINQPRQAPIYSWALIRLMAAALLFRGAWLRLHPGPTPRAAVVVLGPLALSIAGAALIYVAEPLLPPALATEALDALRSPGLLTGAVPGVSFLEVVLQVTAVVLLSFASYYYLRAARLQRSTAGRYLAIGLVFAAFAQIHFAIFPGAYAGIVSTSDLLKVAFYGFVVFGIQAEIGATLRRLRAANTELDALRESEVARASLEERSRLARELHDGLAQHLWVAKLATERLGRATRFDEVHDIQQELEHVLALSVDEARETVTTLREAGRDDSSMPDALTSYVHLFAQQTGIDAQLFVQAVASDTLPPRTWGELLRIAQEALSNVRKHADATTIAVSLESNEETVRLTVRDNGIGFDSDAPTSGFGLQSMSERAHLIGGSAVIDSSPTAGTTVIVEIPANRTEAHPRISSSDSA